MLTMSIVVNNALIGLAVGDDKDEVWQIIIHCTLVLSSYIHSRFVSSAKSYFPD